ncbi:MAG: hypothetical protein AAGL34_04705 [Bacteroidota bacterium]
MQRRREIVAVILFAMLMCMQTIDLHAFSHCDDSDSEIECTLCAIAIDKQQESYLLPTTIQAPGFFEHNHAYTVVFFDNAFVPILAERKRCVRPPPTLS